MAQFVTHAFAPAENSRVKTAAIKIVATKRFQKAGLERTRRRNAEYTSDKTCLVETSDKTGYTTRCEDEYFTNDNSFSEELLTMPYMTRGLLHVLKKNDCEFLNQLIAKLFEYIHPDKNAVQELYNWMTSICSDSNAVRNVTSIVNKYLIKKMDDEEYYKEEPSYITSNTRVLPEYIENVCKDLSSKCIDVLENHGIETFGQITALFIRNMTIDNALDDKSPEMMFKSQILKKFQDGDIEDADKQASYMTFCIARFVKLKGFYIGPDWVMSSELQDTIE